MPSIRRLGPLHLAHHLRVALRLRRLARRQRLQVLHREQRVLVGGELVVDVVLHQAGQRARTPAGSGRAPPARASRRQGLRHPAPVPADVEEQVAHLGRARGSASSDQVERILQRALQVERQLEAEPVRVPEHLHEPHRVLRKARPSRSARCSCPSKNDEPVGRAPPAARRRSRRAAPRERLLAARDQPAGHPVDHARVQVVLAHELLDAQRAARRSRSRGSWRSAAAGPAMRTSFLWPEKKCSSLRTRHRKVRAASVAGLLARRDEPLVGQLAQRARAELGGPQPHGGVDVAQAARRLLHVRLADVGRVRRTCGSAGRARPASSRGTRRSPSGRRSRAAPCGTAIEEPAGRPADEPRLLHRGAAGKVGAGHGHAIRERRTLWPTWSPRSHSA